MSKYYIAIRNHSDQGWRHKAVEGERVEGTPFDLFLHENYEGSGFNVSEATTGMSIRCSYSSYKGKHEMLKKEAIKAVLKTPLLIAESIGRMHEEGKVTPLCFDKVEPPPCEHLELGYIGIQEQDRDDKIWMSFNCMACETTVIKETWPEIG